MEEKTPKSGTALAEILGRGRLRQELPEPEMRRHLRRRAGLTQQDIAEAVSQVAGRSVSRVSATRWENGVKTPRGVLLAAYVTVLDRLAAEVSGRV